MVIYRQNQIKIIRFDSNRSYYLFVFTTLNNIKWILVKCYSISQEICTRFIVLCFVVVMQSFIMNSHEVFIHIHQGCFAGTGAIVRLPQCQWSKPDGYGKISQCITTTKHSKAKTVCIFLWMYCISGTPGPLLSQAMTKCDLSLRWPTASMCIMINTSIRPIALISVKRKLLQMFLVTLSSYLSYNLDTNTRISIPYFKS